ncbi:replication initiator protein [Capybara microvirus Cap3_SP_562]|nr:replication initiator protein [Capybara microvirus Cap3_SP_562]
MCVNPKFGFLVTDSFRSGLIKRSVHFCTKEHYLYMLENVDIYKNEYHSEPMTFPCGRCPECCMEHADAWAYRIMNEASQYDDNCFITLTYANTDNVNYDNASLQKKDVQDFVKRLRERIRRASGKKIRFFCCGEYGEKKQRPHYHIIIFGWKPNDLKYFKTINKHIVYTSEFVRDVWKWGFITVSEVELETALYSALYMQKLLPKQVGKSEPFLLMSTNPGIGYNFLINNIDNLILTDKIIVNGHTCKLPRYYLRVLEDKLLLDTSTLRKNRSIKSELAASSLDFSGKIEIYKKLYNWFIPDT